MNESDETEPKYAPAIDNDSSRYQVLSLSKLRLPPEIQRPQSEHGPFVVLQQGSMPGDPHSKPHDFLLTKEGLWLPLFAFIRLSTQERDQLCIFSTAAEAVQQVEDLTGSAIIDAERTARALQIELPTTPPDEPDAPV